MILSIRFWNASLALTIIRALSCGIVLNSTSIRRRRAIMIIGKIWRSFKAQLNKLANSIRGSDPIAEMQYEYDRSVEELKSGREGLAQYRALVERVGRQVTDQQKHIALLEAKIKAYLTSGDRDGAGKLAMDLQRAKNDLQENQKQLELHETAYSNNLLKIKHAVKKLEDVKNKIAKYDADLKMSKAESELSELAHQFDFNLTTDFGQAESMIQDKIDKNRARVRVAADLSSEGVDTVKHEMAIEKSMAEDALKQFEREAGLVTPETASSKPAVTQQQPKALEPLPEVGL
jgi:phage shock protein A